MPGLGKGALRIALEDFLESFHFGEVYKNITKEVSEHFEYLIYDEYKPYFDQLHAIPGLENFLKLRFNPDGTPASQGAVAAVVSMAISSGMQVGGGMFSPFSTLLRYQTEKVAHSQRLDPGAAIAVSKRRDDLLEKAYQDMRDMGYDEWRISALHDISIPRLDEGSMIRWELRHMDQRIPVFQELLKRGWLSTDIEKMEELAQVIPPINDLVMMQVREAWDDNASGKFGYDNEYPADAAPYAAKIGLSDYWLKKYWRSHWTLPSVTAGYDMLHRLRPGKSKNPFTLSDMELLLKVSDYPTYWRPRLIELSYLPFTRVDVRRMYSTGDLDPDGVYQAYLDLGYDEYHAGKLRDFTIHYENESGSSKLDQMRDLSISQVQKMYDLNLMPKTEVIQHLTEAKYLGADAEALVRLWDTQKALDLIPDNRRSYINAALNRVIDAYTFRMIDTAQAKESMKLLGLPQDQIEIAINGADYDYNYGVLNGFVKAVGDAYANGGLSRGEAISKLSAKNIPSGRVTQILGEFDDIKNIRGKRLSLAQYTKLWQQGYDSQDVYIQNLKDLGYSDPDIDRLLILGTPPDESAT